MNIRLGKAMGIILASLLVVLVPALGGSESGKTVVRVKGSSSVAGAVDRFVAGFKKQNPDIDVIVIGGTSGSGLRALMEGIAEVALTDRKAHVEELKEAKDQGKELKEYVLGVADVPLIVHPSNPIDKLDMGQFRGILAGRTTNWKQVGGKDLNISFMAVDPDIEVSMDFYYSVFTTSNGLLGMAIPSEAVPQRNFKHMVYAVGREPGSVALCRISDIRRLRREGQLSMVKLIALLPSPFDNKPYNPKRLPYIADTSKLHNGDRIKHPYELQSTYYLYDNISSPGSQGGRRFIEYCIKRIGSN